MYGRLASCKRDRRSIKQRRKVRASLWYMGFTDYELGSQVLTYIKALNVVSMDFMYKMLSILVIKVLPR